MSSPVRGSAFDCSAFDWLFVALVAAVFAPALMDLAGVWSRLAYYSHGFLVPLVSVWAATAQRGVLPELPVRRDPRGLALIGLAVLAYGLALITGTIWVEGLALVAAVAGSVLYLRGPAWLRALRFPIAFLLFMVPIPETWIAPLITQLQLLVSSAGVGLLRLFGFSIYREGNVIVLPGGHDLFVAEACSGITSIITLLPLAVFLGYFTERRLSRRLILVLAVVPVAMAGNLLRVVGTIVASSRWGPEAATSGPVHDTAGLAVYVVGCLGLIGVGALMRSWWPATPRPSAS